MIHTLLFGKFGQVGWELRRTLATLGPVTALDYPEVDFTNSEQLREIVRRAQPQAIVNAAAYTAVDRAENEPALAAAINETAPGVLAKEARRVNAALVHYSTEYVFDGKKDSPYVETDEPNPLNVYGHSKLAGEHAVQEAGGAFLILRTSWVYSLRQGGFVTKVLQWSRQQPQMRVVSDQVGSPTWCRMLAEATAQVLAMSGSYPAGWLSERAGLYHLAGDGAATRYEWAQAILEADPKRDEQVVKSVLPASTDEFPTPACRPLYAPLKCDLFEQTFGLRLPPWKEGLHRLMEKE